VGINKIQTTYWTDDEDDYGLQFSFKPVEGTVKEWKTETGYAAKYLTLDEYAERPDSDDALFLVHYHRQFWVTRDEIVTQNDAKDWYAGLTIPQMETYWIYPVSAYIHSGVFLYLGRGSHPFDHQG
jgi:hypothetical protein